MLATDEIHGRIIIVWPRPTGGPVLHSNLTRVIDADTCQEFTDGTSLRINLGTPGGWTGGPIIAEMTRITGADGQPLNGRAVEFVDGEVPIGTFRYAVAEMKVAD